MGLSVNEYQRRSIVIFSHRNKVNKTNHADDERNKISRSRENAARTDLRESWGSHRPEPPG